MIRLECNFFFPLPGPWFFGCTLLDSSFRNIFLPCFLLRRRFPTVLLSRAAPTRDYPVKRSPVCLTFVLLSHSSEWREEEDDRITLFSSSPRGGFEAQDLDNAEIGFRSESYLRNFPSLIDCIITRFRLPSPPPPCVVQTCDDIELQSGERRRKSPAETRQATAKQRPTTKEDN